MKRLFAIGLSLLMLVEFSATVVASEFIWCATVENVEFIRASKCQSKGGRSFSSDKSRAEAEHQRLEALTSVAPGKFVKYERTTWVTAPMNTEEAIEYYFKGRKLDPIEGVWGFHPTEGFKMVIVRNTFDTYPAYIAPGSQYVGIITNIGSLRSRRHKDECVGWEKEATDQQRGLISVRLNQLSNSNRYRWHETLIDIYKEVNRTKCYRNHTKSNPACKCRLPLSWSWSKVWDHLLSSDSRGLSWIDDFETPHQRFLKLYPTDEPTVEVGGSGTGFLVSSDGYIVTNHHVIEGANKITVTTPSGESFEAKVVSSSTSTDLALLRIPYQTKNYLTFANPGSTDIGHQVFTLGYPVSNILGKEVKYTDGSISSLSGIQGDATFFQISVPIQPGNSGGPLVNTDGDVVGVVTATAAVEAFYASVGVMPQNINWAVKGAYASLLLPPTMEMNERPKSNPIANAKWSVVFIETE